MYSMPPSHSCLGRESKKNHKKPEVGQTIRFNRKLDQFRVCRHLLRKHHSRKMGWGREERENNGMLMSKIFCRGGSSVGECMYEVKTLFRHYKDVLQRNNTTFLPEGQGDVFWIPIIFTLLIFYIL